MCVRHLRPPLEVLADLVFLLPLVFLLFLWDPTQTDNYEIVHKEPSEGLI